MGRKVTDKDGVEFDLESLIESMVASKGGGDPTKALGLMIEENYQLRTKNSELRGQVEKSTVPEGSRVIKKEDAEAFDKYVALGKPDEVTKKLTERGEFETKYNDLQRDQLIRDAAGASQMKHTVLGDLVRSKNLDLTMGEVEVDDGKGTKVKQPAAFVKDAQGQQKLLKDVIKEQFNDYVPALALPAGNQQPAGTPWVSQQPAPAVKDSTQQSQASSYLANTYGHLLEQDKKSA